MSGGNEPGRPHAYRNWHELKIEWIASGEGLGEFARRKGINESVAYRHARKDKWFEARAELEKKQLQAIEKKMATDAGRQWDRFHGTMDKIITKIEHVLESREYSSAKLTSLDLEAIGSLLEKLARTKGMILGVPTQRIAAEVKGKLEGEVHHVNHGQVLGLLEAFKRGDPSVIDVRSIEDDDPVKPETPPPGAHGDRG